MKHVATIAPALLFPLLLSGHALPAQEQQEPAPPVTADGVRALLDRYLDQVGSDAGRQACTELAAWIERDYPAVFAVWRQESGVRRTCLENMLSIPAVREAAVVVHGAVVRTEVVQGGVVDDHRRLLHFADLRVLRAGAEARAGLREGSFALLRGTSRDSWLAAQLAANVERVQGARIWLFQPRMLLEPRVEGGPEVAVIVQEWTVLPAAAAPCVRELLQ